MSYNGMPVCYNCDFITAQVHQNKGNAKNIMLKINDKSLKLPTKINYRSLVVQIVCKWQCLG